MTWIEALDILERAADIYVKVAPPGTVTEVKKTIEKTQADLIEEAKPGIPYGWIIGGVVLVIGILLVMRYVK